LVSSGTAPHHSTPQQSVPRRTKPNKNLEHTKPWKEKEEEENEKKGKERRGAVEGAEPFRKVSTQSAKLKRGEEIERSSEREKKWKTRKTRARQGS
jgi:hypothetical protein